MNLADEFPISAEWTYLNTATQGPLPNRTRRAVERALARAQLPGTPPGQAEAHPAELTRARLGGLLGVGADQIALTANTTTGLNICAHGIDWRPGDNLVMPEHEFPSLMQAWLGLRAQGVEVRRVPFDGPGPAVDALMAATDSRTRVVTCSAVSWDTGYRIDLEDLGRRCARAGALLVVDGIQAVGAIELDPEALRLSALSFHGYKWLVSSFGVGALYVAPAAVEQIHPRFVGEQAFLAEDDPFALGATYQPGARRYAAGGPNLPGLSALAESLALIDELGLATIAAHNRALGEQLVAGLGRLAPALRLVSPADPERRAAIVVFTLGDPGRDGELTRRLEAAGILVAHRRRGVRVSPHFYNGPEDIDRLLRALPPIIAEIG